MVATQGHTALITVVAFLSVSFVIVTSRIYTRTIILKNAGPDDWFMLAALVAAIAFAVVVGFQVKYGLGRPFGSLEHEEITKFFQTLWATIPMYNLALVLTKISIVFQYIRIFTHKKVQRLCYGMVGILTIYGCWTVIGSFCMCIPIASFWDQSISGHCMNKLAFWFSNAALNILTDIMIFTFPMPLLRALHLPRNQKIGLMVVFAFGGFVCITSIIRLRALYLISTSKDTSLDGVSTAIWSGVEINVAISCSSLPAIKPLLSRIFPGLLSTASSRSKNTYGPDSHSTSKIHISTLRNQSYQLSELNESESGVDGKGKRDIVVVKSVVLERDVRFGEASEEDLVVKSDCYANRQHGGRI